MTPYPVEMKKYPDNSEFYELKEKRRQEVREGSAIERLRTAKRLQRMGKLVSKTRATPKPHDASWSVVNARPDTEVL